MDAHRAGCMPVSKLCGTSKSIDDVTSIRTAGGMNSRTTAGGAGVSTEPKKKSLSTHATLDPYEYIRHTAMKLAVMAELGYVSTSLF